MMLNVLMCIIVPLIFMLLLLQLLCGDNRWLLQQLVVYYRSDQQLWKR